MYQGVTDYSCGNNLKMPVQDPIKCMSRIASMGNKSNTIQGDAVNHLKWAGRPVAAGEKIRYVINDYSRKSKRVVPIEIASPDGGCNQKECWQNMAEEFELTMLLYNKLEPAKRKLVCCNL